MKKYAEVIVGLSVSELDRAFHYVIPDFMQVECGMRVLIPFGKRKTEGYVIGLTDETGIEESKLKSIIRVIDSFPVFEKEMLELAKWMRDKYYTTLNQVLQCILPAGIRVGEALQDFNERKYIQLVDINEARSTLESMGSNKNQASQAALISRLIEEGEIALDESLAASTIKTLTKKNIICIVRRLPQINADEEIDFTKSPVLNYEQDEAVQNITKYICNSQAKTVLIHGVTGSGKTEVYLRLIQETVRKGKDAIMLVPEISLTPQTVNRIIERFGKLTSLTHSRMTARERLMEWQKAREGSVKIMLGPRSAVFAPFKNLGLIIIDEEHENTYKSETTPKYDAREVASMRMNICGGVLVLGSATPSVETYHSAETGNIMLQKLKNRVGSSKLPRIDIVDMRNELIEGNRSIFSIALRKEIDANLKRKEQIILFLNRRGHSSFVSCRKCGFVVKCDSCSISYTYHKFSNNLMCHYCGKTIANPEICPQCGSKYIKYFGVGTQKVEDELKRLYPDTGILRMDMDTTSKKDSHARILKAFSTGEAQILIGTQMIAKGHDFPRVTLVGILAADMSLHVGDYSSSETTYQLLTQVSGRAGRSNLEGRVIIQTYDPENYSIVHSKDQSYEEFYAQEISIRRQMKYPPFSHFFMINFFGEDEKKLIICLYKLTEVMKYYNRKGMFEIIGPMPCFISKIKDRYRWKLLVKGDEENMLKSFVLYCMDKLNVDLGDITVSLTLNPKYII